MINGIRNVAIIAHVDHGKTTLVDALLKQSKTKLGKDASDTLIMDRNELEKERGITIFSKNASLIFQNTKINIIDTPGHADFGGEVERVLKMADGCLLLIDAKEGPMPQTRFVLKKALQMGLVIIVVVNKIDKKDARSNYALDKTLDLFLELGADDKTADFPMLFASAKEGKAGLTDDLSKMSDITPVFTTILEKIPPPKGSSAQPLQMLVTTLSSDPHKGKIAIGRVYNGSLKKAQEIAQIKRDGTVNKAKITSLMTFSGLDLSETAEVSTGDIAAVCGISNPSIGETIADGNNPVSMPLLIVEEPTIKMAIQVNTSPFAGREGQFKTSRQLKDRLYKELETDMALRVEEDPNGSAFILSGRGELHLSIFLERMRREGYEFQVAKPQVIDKVLNGQILTPYEKVYIEIPQDFNGIVMQKLNARRAVLFDTQSENGMCFMEFVISTKGLFSYRSEFISDTRGLGTINTVFYRYDKETQFSYTREQGSLIAFESGVTNSYGLSNSQERGLLFVGPGIDVYKGQVVGQHSRSTDLTINVCKTKQLSNMRSKGEGVSVALKSYKAMGLEDALEYISDDELVEVTPKSIRIRKLILDPRDQRRKQSQGLL